VTEPCSLVARRWRDGLNVENADYADYADFAVDGGQKLESCPITA
jgi:hypothetical protein